MSKKLTYEYVKQYFKDNNCELLEDIYINNNTEMQYKCSCENISYITFGNFMSGKRCKKCGGNEKIKIDYIKQYFKDKGCELLETDYINRGHPMKYICKCGNISKIAWKHFKTEHRCKQCGSKKISSSRSGEKNNFWNPDRKQVEKNKFYHIKYKNLLKNCLNRIGKLKETNTNEILGYSAKQLQEHIENHPNFEKVKDGKWHIDHIFPVKAFIEHDIYDAKIINSLDNLQPLSQFENISKSDKYIEEDFMHYCATKGAEQKMIKN